MLVAHSNDKKMSHLMFASIGWTPVTAGTIAVTGITTHSIMMLITIVTVAMGMVVFVVLALIGWRHRFRRVYGYCNVTESSALPGSGRIGVGGRSISKISILYI
jgi:uncharacterized membrane protein